MGYFHHLRLSWDDPPSSRFQPNWFHCPLNVPVALESSSKSGSTSVGRWALQMDFPKGRDFASLGAVNGRHLTESHFGGESNLTQIYGIFGWTFPSNNACVVWVGNIMAVMHSWYDGGWVPDNKSKVFRFHNFSPSMTSPKGLISLKWHD